MGQLLHFIIVISICLKKSQAPHLESLTHIKFTFSLIAWQGESKLVLSHSLLLPHSLLVEFGRQP
ncbi:hypothetical protein DBT51_04510 [Aerococcus loyolae]|nr:hypothetical protein DBT51_04510 [Aerococcus loyolae]